jgi:hypothetical protein
LKVNVDQLQFQVRRGACETARQQLRHPEGRRDQGKFPAGLGRARIALDQGNAFPHRGRPGGELLSESIEHFRGKVQAVYGKVHLEFDVSVVESRVPAD